MQFEGLLSQLCDLCDSLIEARLILRISDSVGCLQYLHHFFLLQEEVSSGHRFLHFVSFLLVLLFFMCSPCHLDHSYIWYVCLKLQQKLRQECEKNYLVQVLLLSPYSVKYRYFFLSRNKCHKFCLGCFPLREDCAMPIGLPTFGLYIILLTKL